MPNYDVLIVGGGVTGAAIGFGLARRNIKTCLIDAVPVFSRATRANMGLIWCQSKALGCPPFVRWGFASSQAYPALAQDLKEIAGIDIGYAPTGGIIPCLGEADLTQRANFIEKLRAESKDGTYPAKVLDRKELEAMLPKVNFGPEVVGGIWSNMDAYVDPLQLMFALRKAMSRLGGTVLSGTRVSKVVPEGSGYKVFCEHESFTCAKLVLAAGLGTRKLAGQLGADIPVFPNKSQVLLLERIAEDILPIPLLGIARTFGGTVMIGAAHENMGMDRTLTPETLARNADWALRVWPDLAKRRILRFWSGLRVWPKDAYPIYDRLPGHENAFVFVMHSAISLAAILERHLPDYVLGQELPEDARLFQLDRFADGKPGLQGSAASAASTQSKR